MPPKPPIDPLDGPKFALAGRVVVMDAPGTVIRRGVLYVEKGRIVAVRDSAAAPPPGFESVTVVNTRGTLFPGMIELHNHLSYNALTLWDVPKRYTNRDQWSGTDEYRQLVSGPMNVVGNHPDLLPALIRYVECKCLVAGVTTTQGIQLFSNMGVRRFYRGIVRNAEQTDDVDLPEAATRVADIDARESRLFHARLLKQSCFLLHLSEGIDATARKHFLALQMAGDEWAISPQLAGIHSAGLTEQDFARLSQNGGAMIWSPLSNLLLYGDTARVKAAKASGVRIGLGSDWSPSGSKNLLGELKVAQVFSAANGGIFSDREIVEMATRTAASILQWDRALGTLEAGKRADVLVIDDLTHDPYSALIQSKETSVQLVIINGVPRYGTPTLMTNLGAAGDRVTIGGRQRILFLKQATGDPVVAALGLSAARDQLKDAFKRLPQLARALEQPPPAPMRASRVPIDRPQPLVWKLALDELQPTGFDLRPRLPGSALDSLTGPTRALARPAKPLSEILKPLELDPLTVAEDPRFLDRISRQKNLPAFMKQELVRLIR